MKIDTVINTKKLEGADVVIVSAPYEKTASSRKGTVNGPKEVIKCLNMKLEFFDRDLKCEPHKFIKTGFKNLGNISSLSPQKALDKVRNECEKLITKNKFVFVLGGEHSVSLGNLQALSKKVDSKDTTIIQIDAHCDLRNDNSDYFHDSVSNLAHSCVMRRASELGYKLVQVGIRTYSVDEYKYFSDPKNNITVFEWGKGKIPTIEEILKSIKTKNVYITIDVDGFDPAYMPGTGTPVQGGLEWWYGMELITRIVNEKNLIGADIVEVSPMKDSVLTEYGAAQLCYSIIANKFKDKLK